MIVLGKNLIFSRPRVRPPNVTLPENDRNKNGAACWCDCSSIRLRHLYVNFVLLEIQCSDSLRKVIKKIWNIIYTTRLKEPFCKLQRSTQYVSLHHMLKKILHIVEYINSLKQHKFLIGVSTYKKMHMWTTWVMDITI